MVDVINDNEAGAVADVPMPDPHGQAAILLVESLIHALIEKSVISMGDALAIVDVAADVVAEIAADLGDRAEKMQPSLALLAAINKSLRIDQ